MAAFNDLASKNCSGPNPVAANPSERADLGELTLDDSANRQGIAANTFTFSRQKQNPPSRFLIQPTFAIESVDVRQRSINA